MRIVYILVFLAALGWLVYSWRKKADLKLPIVAAAGTVLLNFIPFLSYLLLLGTLGWGGFSFYKKRNVKEIKMPIIAAVGALVLVLTAPSSGVISGGITSEFFGSGSAIGKTAVTEDTAYKYLIDNLPAARGESLVSVQLWNHNVVRSRIAKNGENIYLVSLTNTDQYFVTSSGEIYNMKDIALKRLYP